MDSAATRRRRRRVADANRKRAARACDRCKARKSKCVESTPGNCLRCLSGNLVCKFERELSIPPAESYSSTTPGNIPGSGLSATINHRVPNPRDDLINHDGLLSPASVLSQRLAEHVVAGQSKKTPWPNILSGLREAFSLDPNTAHEERNMVAMQAHLTRPKAIQPSEIARLNAAIEAFPPRSIADFLLSVFIKHATDLFFYFDQDQILTEIDQFYKDVNCPLRFDFGFVCLLLATFALGSQWTALERPEGSAVNLNRDTDDLGRVFYTHAKTLIPDIIDRSCLRSIQAPFLLGVYLMPANAIGSSYVYMGLALRKALAFDLHLISDDGTVDEKENEIRRRLWWSIYTLERCTTIKLNRPRSISIDIIKTAHPSPLPVLDCRQRYNNIQFQMAYTQLIKILDQIADSGKNSSEWEEDSRFESWESDLQEWKKALPVDFKIDSMDPKDSRYRSIFHLYLNYYYAWITMGKVALVTVARTNLQRHIDPMSQLPEPSQVVLRQSRSCAKAARKILFLFETVTRNQMIARFSFTDFQGCSIATIVTLVSGITDRDSGYTARVAFGLACLRNMAIGNTTAKMGVTFVEAVQTITEEARDKLHQAAPIVTEPRELQPSTSVSVSDYNRWAEWFTNQERYHIQEQLPVPREVSRAENDIPSSQTCLQSAAANIETMSSWRTANEQFGLEENLLSHSLPIAQDIAYPEDDFSLVLQSDDPTFLMGLTGLDLLDFSGIT